MQTMAGPDRAARLHKRTGSRLRRRLLLLLAVVLLAGPFVIEYFGGQHGIPSWSELYTAVGFPPEELPTLQNGETFVAVLDVGQGDAVLLVQDGEACLIDTGTYESRETLVNDLHRMGVEKLAYLMLTHPHSDHTGGASAVLDAFPVGQLLLPEWEPADEEDADWPYTLETKAAENGAELVTTVAGQQYPLGSGTLTVLQGGRGEADGDDSTRTDQESASVNNASLCLLFAAGEFRFLDTGDAEADAERRLVDTYGSTLRADLMKAGHHGSSTSNTAELLAVVRPKAVAVSCGADNDYGHPHREALENFAAAGAAIYRTDQQGTIVFTVQDGEMTAATTQTTNEDQLAA